MCDFDIITSFYGFLYIAASNYSNLTFTADNITQDGTRYKS